MHFFKTWCIFLTGCWCIGPFWTVSLIQHWHQSSTISFGDQFLHDVKQWTYNAVHWFGSPIDPSLLRIKICIIFFFSSGTITPLSAIDLHVQNCERNQQRVTGLCGISSRLSFGPHVEYQLATLFVIVKTGLVPIHAVHDILSKRFPYCIIWVKNYIYTGFYYGLISKMIPYKILNHKYIEIKVIQVTGDTFKDSPRNNFRFSCVYRQ